MGTVDRRVRVALGVRDVELEVDMLDTDRLKFLLSSMCCPSRFSCEGTGGNATSKLFIALVKLAHEEGLANANFNCAFHGRLCHHVYIGGRQVNIDLGPLMLLV